MSADEGIWIGPMRFNEPVMTVKVSDLKPPRDPFTEFLTDLRDRLIAIEARQRAYGQHDPDCTVLLADRAQQRNPNVCFVRTEVCTCWLSQEAS